MRAEVYERSRQTPYLVLRKFYLTKFTKFYVLIEFENLFNLSGLLYVIITLYVCFPLHFPPNFQLPTPCSLLMNELFTMNVIWLIYFLSVAIRYWQKEEISSDEWDSIVKSSYLPVTTFEELFSGVLNLTLGVLRIPENKFSVEKIRSELISLG